MNKDRENTVIKDTETEMQAAFQIQKEELLSRESEFVVNDTTVRVGLEVEYSLIRDDNGQSSEVNRDALVDRFDFLDAELGAAQIELRTEPVVINDVEGLAQLHGSLISNHTRMAESANGTGDRVLSSGTNPFISLDQIVRTNKLKYEQVPDFHNNNRKRVDTCLGSAAVEVGDAAIVSILNSVQANVEAHSFSEAIDLMNRSFAIGPMAVALGSNAALIDHTDTSFRDVRMEAWLRSHDTRTISEIYMGRETRIGLPSEYFTDMNDYLEKISRFPFILNIPEAALPIAVGLNWRDTRVKFIGNRAVVEFRPVSTQPTDEENMALMAFYVGRLLWSSQNKERLMPMNLVRQNKFAAERKGMDTSVWHMSDSGIVSQLDARKSLAIQVDKAFIGLAAAGVVENEWLKNAKMILMNNIDTGSPADKLSRQMAGRSNISSDELRNFFETQMAIK